MNKTALITGASSGIGMELARYHAGKGGDLILTARRKDRLAELKTELEEKRGVKVVIIPLDLSAEGGADKLYETVKKKKLKVDILINNAGFGGRGTHVERDLDSELQMIDLNVKALVTLTHRFAADMVEQGGGKILNVGSTAGFMPGPLQAVYFASKAFVNSYSQAVDQELRDKGVTCTLLAPGYVKTEFAQVADLEGTQLVGQRGAMPKDAAREGYMALRSGELICFNDGILGFLVGRVLPLMPRRLVLAAVSWAQKK